MKRRSNPAPKRKRNTYGPKRRSGQMMFGPTRTVPKYPDFRATYPPRNKYWWGESREPGKKGVSRSEWLVGSHAYLLNGA